MGTLDFEVIRPLVIPEEAWGHDVDGVAVIVVTGTSYGGMWVLHAMTTHTSEEESSSIGEIETDPAVRRPDLAVDAASEWVERYCHASGYLLHRTCNLNHSYGPDEAPFFASASFVIDRRRPDTEEGSN